jgi:CTP:molybdopterin cytidylyltransferase MocA
MLAVAVLAAGKGTRMKSDLPKVLQPLAGATLVERVLASCRHLLPQRQLLIVGHQAQRVERSLSSVPGLEFVLQQPQNGTGHAVQQLLEPLSGFQGELLVLNGDVPLLRPSTLEELLAKHRSSGANLDGVAQRRARAVHLQDAHRLRTEARRAAPRRQAHHLLLRRPVGGGVGAGAAVLVDRGAVHGDAAGGAEGAAGVSGVVSVMGGSSSARAGSMAKDGAPCGAAPRTCASRSTGMGTIEISKGSQSTAR